MDREAGKIILLRHAHAAWPMPGEKDFDRKLDERGHEEARQMAEKLKSLGIVPSAVLCSPAARCVETLAAFEKTWSKKPKITMESDLYDGGLPTYAEIVAEEDENSSLMIIGHNPMIEDIFAFMADGQQEDFLGYATAGLAIMHKESGTGHDSKWRLDAFLQPSSSL